MGMSYAEIKDCESCGHFFRRIMLAPICDNEYSKNYMRKMHWWERCSKWIDFMEWLDYELLINSVPKIGQEIWR